MSGSPDPVPPPRLTRRLRILFLVRALDYGGAQRQLIQLAFSLRERGHDVAVAVYYSGGQMEKALRESGVRVIDLGKRNRWHLLGFLSRLLRVVREEQPDILHGYLPVSNILAVLTRLLVPDIRAVMGVRASNMDISRYGRMSALSYKVEAWLSRGADLIITNSVAGFGHAKRTGMPIDRMVVIPNGIDTNRFRPDREGGLAVRRAWGVPAEAKLIGMIGRLDPMKGHETFLRAVAYLKDRVPDARFVCVGDGSEQMRAHLHRFTERLGVSDRVIWAHSRPEVTPIFGALDVMCLASEYGEGFPNVVGEAMACGVPCVVTDVGDAARVVGETGIVVPPADPAALADGIARMLAWQAADGPALAGRVRARVEENFTVDQLGWRSEAMLGRMFVTNADRALCTPSPSST